MGKDSEWEENPRSGVGCGGIHNRNVPGRRDFDPDGWPAYFVCGLLQYDPIRHGQGREVMRYAVLITLPLLSAGCAAFQTGATPEAVADAENLITTGGAMIMPFLGPFAPFAPIGVAIAHQIGKMIRAKGSATA